jgi:hypothetical protein
VTGEAPLGFWQPDLAEAIEFEPPVASDEASDESWVGKDASLARSAVHHLQHPLSLPSSGTGTEWLRQVGRSPEVAAACARHLGLGLSELRRGENGVYGLFLGARFLLLPELRAVRAGQDPVPHADALARRVLPRHA